MWTACFTGIDERRFPLYKITALRLSLKESTESLHSCGHEGIHKALYIGTEYQITFLPEEMHHLVVARLI